MQELSRDTGKYRCRDGQYEVTVSVGDSQAQGSDGVDFHRINVEGVNFIDNFQTSASTGSNARHSNATDIVTVTDGRLTIDQNGGGENTKINYVDITQIGDALLFDRPSITLTVPVDDTATGQVVLKTTNGSVNYSIDLSGAPSWLTNVSGPQPTDDTGVNIDLDVDTTGQSIGAQLTYTIEANRNRLHLGTIRCYR